MRETNYMSSSALIEFLKVGILAGELDIIAANTKKTAKTPKEKRWAKDMRMSATLLQKITDERVAVLDKDQLESVARRNQHSKMVMETTHNLRVGKGRIDDRITVDYDDLALIAEMALMCCNSCPQGKYVKDCEYRKMFHRLGIPVGREDVCEGECEFMTSNKPKILLPQGNTDPEAHALFDDEREFI